MSDTFSPWDNTKYSATSNSSLPQINILPSSFTNIPVVQQFNEITKKILRGISPLANYTDKRPPLVGEARANFCG
jgi:hypothetical protein